MAENLLEHPITEQVQIYKLIPQKVPFVMVDSLYEYTELTGITGFLITEDNILVKDAVLSEAGLIEHMAQSMSLHRGYQGKLAGQDKPKTGFIGAIKTVEIHTMPKVGERLKTYVEILQEVMNVTLVSSKTENEKGELIAASEMKTVTVQ